MHSVSEDSLSLPSLARTVFLRLASLLVLLGTLWNQISCGEAECKACGYNYKELPVRRSGSGWGTPGSLKERRGLVVPDFWLGRKEELGMLEYSPHRDRNV